MVQQHRFQSKKLRGGIITLQHNRFRRGPGIISTCRLVRHLCVNIISATKDVACDNFPVRLGVTIAAAGETPHHLGRTGSRYGHS